MLIHALRYVFLGTYPGKRYSLLYLVNVQLQVGTFPPRWQPSLGFVASRTRSCIYNTMKPYATQRKCYLEQKNRNIFLSVFFWSFLALKRHGFIFVDLYQIFFLPVCCNRKVKSLKKSFGDC